MAGQSVLQFLSDLFLKVIPSPIVWAVLLLAVFAGYMGLKRFPSSVSMHFAFILLISLATWGGIFTVLPILMYALSGVAAVAALLKLSGRL